MDRRIEDLILESDFDVIHADQLWMAPYALRAAELSKQKRGRPHLVLDQHNAVHLIPARMGEDVRNPLARALLKREARLMKRYEAQMCTRFDHVVWVTNEDRNAVKKLMEPAQSNHQEINPDIHFCSDDESVIPICVDPQEIQPVDHLTSEPKILFVGGMHWPPNAEGVRWFNDEILPLIKKRFPEQNSWQWEKIHQRN